MCYLEYGAEVNERSSTTFSSGCKILQRERERERVREGGWGGVTGVERDICGVISMSWRHHTQPLMEAVYAL